MLTREELNSKPTSQRFLAGCVSFTLSITIMKKAAGCMKILEDGYDYYVAM